MSCVKICFLVNLVSTESCNAQLSAHLTLSKSFDFWGESGKYPTTKETWPRDDASRKCLALTCPPGKDWSTFSQKKQATPKELHTWKKKRTNPPLRVTDHWRIPTLNVKRLQVGQKTLDTSLFFLTASTIDESIANKLLIRIACCLAFLLQADSQEFSWCSCTRRMTNPSGFLLLRPHAHKMQRNKRSKLGHTNLL